MSNTTTMECKCCATDGDCIDGLCQCCNEYNYKLKKQRDVLLDGCKMAMAWFDKHTNDEPVWEDQPSADMATLMQDAIAPGSKISRFNYNRLQGMCGGL